MSQERRVRPFGMRLIGEMVHLAMPQGCYAAMVTGVGVDIGAVALRVFEPSSDEQRPRDTWGTARHDRLGADGTWHFRDECPR